MRTRKLNGIETAENYIKKYKIQDEDLVQEILLIGCENKDKPNGYVNNKIRNFVASRDKHCCNDVYISDYVKSGTSTFFLNYLEQEGFTDSSIDKVECSVMQSALRDAINVALGTLTEREEEILRLYYEMQLSLDDIAELHCVTRERVRQIILKALRKLRHPSRSRKLEAYIKYI